MAQSSGDGLHLQGRAWTCPGEGHRRQARPGGDWAHGAQVGTRLLRGLQGTGLPTSRLPAAVGRPRTRPSRLDWLEAWH